MCGKKAGHPTLGVDVGEASPDDSNSNTASAQAVRSGTSCLKMAHALSSI